MLGLVVEEGEFENFLEYLLVLLIRVADKTVLIRAVVIVKFLVWWRREL